MLINLSDALASEGYVAERQAGIELTKISCRMGDFPIIEKKPVSLTLTNLGTNKASIEGKTELTLAMNCDRCLKPVPTKIPLHFVRQVVSPDEYSKEDDGQNFMEGYQLNIDGLIKNECLMDLPVKVLCKPDCKGICMQCGKDLNEGECGCDRFVPDPRMARIKDIFEAKREV
ncbi:MAG: DUF177 domain-containing protein [Kineothrix sp.]|nr:DUF177 domain-containing protein [Kineothrix sp.]